MVAVNPAKSSYGAVPGSKRRPTGELDAGRAL